MPRDLKELFVQAQQHSDREAAFALWEESLVQLDGAYLLKAASLLQSHPKVLLVLGQK